MAAVAGYLTCLQPRALVPIATRSWALSAARRTSVRAQARQENEGDLSKPDKVARPGGVTVASTMVAYFGVLHYPLGVQGLSVVAGLLHQEALDPPTKAVSLLLLQSMELAGTLWLVRDSLKEFPPTDQFRFSLSGASNWAPVVGAGAALLLLGVTVSDAFFVHQQVELPVREAEKLGAFRELFTAGDGITAWATCLVVFGITPFMEELVYRGFLLGSLRGLMPLPLAVTSSALAFAAGHLSLAGFLGYFVVGLVLGLAYARTENLASSFTIHCVYNLFVIAGLLIS